MSSNPDESSEGTADELLERLLHCDAQLAELLRTASQALVSLAEPAPAPSSFDSLAHHWFATLHVRRPAPHTGYPAHAAARCACTEAGAPATAHAAGHRSSTPAWRGGRRGHVTHAHVILAVQPVDTASARDGMAPRGTVARTARRDRRAAPSRPRAWSFAVIVHVIRPPVEAGSRPCARTTAYSSTCPTPSSH